jgi:hypothetical protein
MVMAVTVNQVDVLSAAVEVPRAKRSTVTVHMRAGSRHTEGMNREKSEEHLREIKNILQDFVERWDVLADDEKKDLQVRAKKGLGHIDGVISFVHSAENE